MRRAILHPKTRQLVISKYGNKDLIPVWLIVQLRDVEGVIESYCVRPVRRGYALTLVLAEYNGLPVLNLLERLADSMSRLTGSRFVNEPWRSGGPTDVDMALSLIAGAFHRPPPNSPLVQSA